MPVRRAPSEVDVNKQVNWLSGPGIWVFYATSILVSWLAASALVDDAGMAWTYVHLLHGVVTYYVFHWRKGSAVVEDAGEYDSLTIWEQLDNQMYGTVNRKLFTVMPLLLFVLATHGTDFRKQPLGLNLGVAVVLLVAKLPALHSVRFFGINKY